MKYLITFVVLLVLNTPCFAQVKKKALLVGVGDYPGNQWNDLSSANDLKYLTEALVLQNFTDITTLVDANATKDGILTALRKLKNNAEQNDIIMFHFSGHGQQIQDNENKDETDGYDEALVPHDAKEALFSIDYSGDKHLRDDEIQPILDSIRKKIGNNGSLIVVLDACHSGTATRTGKTIAVTRGEPVPFKIDHDYKAPNIYVAGDGFADAGATASNMIVLSASGPNQVNYETKDVNGNNVGSLSYALARALSELPKGANYNMLFNRIKSDIQGHAPQIPMMEGNGKQEIFGSAYTSYDEIVEVRWDNDSTIRIPAGLLHGLTSSSVIDLYLTGKDQKVMQANPIAVGNFETVARTTKPAASKIGYHAKWESSFGVFAADLFINSKTSTKHSKNISNQLTSYIGRQQNITISSNADYMIDINDEDAKSIRVELVERGDSVRWSARIQAGDTLSDKDKENLLAHLRNAMKVKFLKSMRDGGSLSDDIVVELIPKKPVIVNNEIRVREKEEFDIRITNKGSNDVYFTIINILPNNTAKVLIPDSRETPQEFISKAKGSAFELKGFSVDANTPIGQELFKVIFSRTPMDLRNIFIGVRDRGPGDMLSFESAIQGMVETSLTGTRSGRSNVKPGEVGIITVGFIVVK